MTFCAFMHTDILSFFLFFIQIFLTRHHPPCQNSCVLAKRTAQVLASVWSVKSAETKLLASTMAYMPVKVVRLVDLCVIAGELDKIKKQNNKHLTRVLFVVFGMSSLTSFVVSDVGLFPADCAHETRL